MEPSSSEEQMLRNWSSLQETLGGAKRRAMKALVAEYMSLLKDPPEGFRVRVEDPFNWEVGIYGPPGTPYWGGYFKLAITFPDEYPFEPPKLAFTNRFWHPNVYHNGVVCMSILHDPRTEDVPSGPPKEEKWNPTLSVRTVLLSLISIIGSPNPDSPANVDATKMYRSWIDGEDDTFVQIVADTVDRSKRTAAREGIRIPATLDEYVGRTSERLEDLFEDDDTSSSVYSSEPLSAPCSPSTTPDFFDAESVLSLSLDPGETEITSNTHSSPNNNQTLQTTYNDNDSPRHLGTLYLPLTYSQDPLIHISTHVTEVASSSADSQTSAIGPFRRSLPVSSTQARNPSPSSSPVLPDTTSRPTQDSTIHPNRITFHHHSVLSSPATSSQNHPSTQPDTSFAPGPSSGRQRNKRGRRHTDSPRQTKKVRK